MSIHDGDEVALRYADLDAGVKTTAREVDATEELGAHLGALIERSDKELERAKVDLARAGHRVSHLEDQLERLRRAHVGLQPRPQAADEPTDDLPSEVWAR